MIAHKKGVGKFPFVLPKMGKIIISCVWDECMDFDVSH